ncbi:hypothetical protein N9X66_06045 [Gammaproteobacteria bacterium]|nr:hypothetical protein [Gammaproteobacteria bacterium]
MTRSEVSKQKKPKGFEGEGIQGGESRRLGLDDVVIMSGRTMQWCSSLESDLTFLIFGPDPVNRIP